jgi:hypothetical protein
MDQERKGFGCVAWPAERGRPNRSVMKWIKWTFRTKLACAVAAGLLLTVLLGKFWGVGATLLILVIPVRDR